jgi:hypothetical protein
MSIDQQEGITPPSDAVGRFTIVVNGQPKDVTSRVVTWDEVVDFAFPSERSNPDLSFVVTYEEADESKHDGTLAVGASVRVKKEGTVFYVASRRRS